MPNHNTPPSQRVPSGARRLSLWTVPIKVQASPERPLIKFQLLVDGGVFVGAAKGAVDLRPGESCLEAVFQIDGGATINNRASIAPVDEGGSHELKLDLINVVHLTGIPSHRLAGEMWRVVLLAVQTHPVVQ